MLLAFLCVGMLCGEDGILGISFNDYQLTENVCTAALILIIFYGGFGTKWSAAKPVAGRAILLSTVGVFLTAAAVGSFCHIVLHVGLLESLLIGSVISSTDAASVFSILRAKKLNLKYGTASLLEVESGSNDPMAYLLTIILITFIQSGGMSIPQAILMLVLQLVIGALGGYLLGKMTVWVVNKINISNGSLYPILILAFSFFIFSVVTLCKGNGYLAVYIAGLVFGNSRIVHKRSIATFFDGFTWLWQIVMFLTLGLLVNPHELLPVTHIGLGIGIFMILVARPVSVFLSLLPYKNFSFRAKLYISWVGLRGAVPIIFATYPLIAGIEHAHLFFNIVFFITILSLIIQGTTVTYAAQKLGLVDKPEAQDAFGIDLGDDIRSAMSEIDVTQNVLAHGNCLMELDLPDHTLVVMVKRNARYFIPKGNTLLKENDKLLVISDDDKALLSSYEKLGIKEYTLKKN